MTKSKFKLYNRIVGWIVFAIAAFTYLSTIEPTASLWDCGEFIATSYKLEVGHPPGAPLYMMVQKLMSLLAGHDVTKVAKMMNSLSALASAFTILFLFWSITHIARRILLKVTKREELTTGQIIAVLASGVVGALAYTWSDTFWFSAVEAEVYASSSLFTALVFWLALKWEEHADEPRSYRYILLIAYLMGLSIGVHLLNLLVIPAITLVIYFRLYKPTVKGFTIALLISFVILLFIQYGIIQKIISFSKPIELLFVNSFHLPPNSGLIFYLVVLLGILVYLAYYYYKRKKYLVHNSIVALLLIIFGYMSFALIPIRSMANPPIDENDPEDPFALVSYLDREQYGEHPLIYGQYYDAQVIGKKDRYTYELIGNKYVKTKRTNPKYIYDPKRCTFFPRMYSSQPDHIKVYKEWGGVKEGEKPNFINNLRFFFTYQLGWMYFRYFMWNFAGKQNDIQGFGDALHGNWISGIKWLDEMRLGPQDNLPGIYKNRRSRNTLYLLPLLLGLIGVYYSLKKDQRYFWIITMFFFMTGIAIVLYLNQTPNQPRERDYAYAGSFYAYAIWIGLGVLGLYEFIKKYLRKDIIASVLAFLLTIGVPILMATQEWDDHDRSHRYHTRDFAYDYLMSCAPNAILFTYGDNDTFPLWYLQETEGVRTDVRVVNLSLLSTDWYIKQIRRKAYESDPVPMSLSQEKYMEGHRDYVPIYEQNQFLIQEKYEANKDQFKARYDSLYTQLVNILKNSDFPKLNTKDWNYLNSKEGRKNLKILKFASFVNALSQDEYIKKFNIDKQKIQNLKQLTDQLIADIADSYAPIDAVVAFIGSDDPATKIHAQSGDVFDFCPTKKLLIPVDSAKVVNNGTVPKQYANKIVKAIKFTLPKQYLLKNNLATLDILANFHWNRPIYFATSMGRDNYLGLTPYFRLEGFAYRLVPYKAENVPNGMIGSIIADSLYNKLMHVFRWGNIKDPKFNVSHYVERTVMVMNIRGLFGRTAQALIQEGKLDSAKQVLDKCIEELPNNQIPFDYFMLPIINAYYQINDTATGDSVATLTAKNYIEELRYFEQFPTDRIPTLGNEPLIALQVLQNLNSIAEQYKRKRLSNYIKNELTKAYTFLMQNRSMMQPPR